MANKAVFLDRDHTIMEDPGYLSDAAGVKLLPGVELALKSLAQGGYRLVVVTNQSGIARGLLTEQTLEKIHQELARQLEQKGARLDAIYYCPYHPEGTIEPYAAESDLRKPKPGMLLKAAAEMDLDLAACWMVGDSGRDIEAGQRAGCRTVRLRAGVEHPGEAADEDVLADYSARNLVDAARIILHEADCDLPAAAPGGHAGAGAQFPAGSPAAPGAPVAAEACTSAPAPSEAPAEAGHPAGRTDPGGAEEFRPGKFLASLLQMLAALALLIGFVAMLHGQVGYALYWTMVAAVLQGMVVTAWLAQRGK